MKEDEEGKKTEAYMDMLHVERIGIMTFSGSSLYRWISFL
jgi:hypothetical protein